MRLKLVAQIILAISIFFIIGLFYYSYLIDKKPETTKINENIEYQDESIGDFKSELLNIEYNNLDSDGNIFYLNAKKAIVDDGVEQNTNKVLLEGVTSILNLKNKGIINIFSDNAIYDKITHDTLFFNKVKVEYLNNLILAKNLDIKFSEKKSTIYNDVIFQNSSVNLFTDTVLIDMVSGNIQLKMANKNKTVKILTKNELIN